MSNSTKWTEERRLLFCERWAVGDSAEELRVRFGFANISSVSKLAVRFGCPARQHRPNSVRPVKKPDRVVVKVIQRPPARALTLHTMDVGTWIAAHGVTVCPAAMCAWTSAEVSEDDRVALAAHHDAQEAVAGMPWKERRRAEWRMRAAKKAARRGAAAQQQQGDD